MSSSTDDESSTDIEAGGRAVTVDHSAQPSLSKGTINLPDLSRDSNAIGTTRPMRRKVREDSSRHDDLHSRSGSRRRRRNHAVSSTEPEPDSATGTGSEMQPKHFKNAKISLRLFLVLLLTLQVIFATAVTWAVSDANSRSAVNSLFANSQNVVRNSTLTLRNEILQKLSISLLNFVGNAPTLDALTVDAMDSGNMDIKGDQGLSPEQRFDHIMSHFISHVKHYDIAYSYCGTVDGNYFAALRTTQPTGPPLLSYGSVTARDGTRLDGWYSWDVDYETSALRPATKRLSWEGYDPSVRPWFTQGVSAYNRTSWTAPYLWVGEPPFRLVLGIDAVRPYINPNTGEVYAVAGADFTLKWIGDFLQRQDLGSEDAVVFVVERSGISAGQLIATSQGNPYQLKTSDPACTSERLLAGVDCGEFIRLLATDSEVEIVKEVSRGLESAYGEWSSIPEASQWASKLDNYGLILIETALLTDEHGLDWVMVIAIPEDDILAGIKESNDMTLNKIRNGNNITAIILVCQLLVSIAIAWFAALMVSEPMRQVEKGMRSMTNMEFHHDTSKPSRFRELSSMQSSYRTMRHALKTFHKFLAPSVIQRIVTGAPGAANLSITRDECVLLLGCVDEWSVIAEALSLPHVLRLMESYLSSTSQCVTEANGTVGDFNADQVTCVWRGNNVVHCLNACAAALKQLKCNEICRKMYRKYADKELGLAASIPAEMTFFMCIHTGEAALGNVGSPQLMKYGVVGEMPNQTRNLLAKCQEYGRSIVITAETQRLVSNEYFCYPIDLIQISSASGPAMIYELVCPVKDITPLQQSFGRQCALALEHYVNNEYAMCLDVLEEIMDKHPDYQPAKIIAKRCRQLALSLRGSGMSSEIQVIPAKEIKIKNTIGFGGFSEVFLGEWQGTEIAVKKLKINLSERQVQDPGHLASWRHELVLWSKLRHPNIVFLIGEICDDNWLGLATEFLPGGTLQEFYKKLKRDGRRISSKLKVQIARDIAAGMNYLHTREPKIIHRDLKSSNVLLDDQYRAKVTDFGVSKEITGSIAFTATGTPHWMAPEVLRAGIENAEYDERSDVYSFGMLCWEIVTSKAPWEGAEVLPLLSQLLRHPDTRPAIPADCDPRWSKLITWCWATDKQSRPSFVEVLDYLNKTFEATGGVTRRASVASPKLPVPRRDMKAAAQRKKGSSLRPRSPGDPSASPGTSAHITSASADVQPQASEPSQRNGSDPSSSKDKLTPSAGEQDTHMDATELDELDIMVAEADLGHVMKDDGAGGGNGEGDGDGATSKESRRGDSASTSTHQHDDAPEVSAMESESSR